jgi:hypothetical protein
MLYVARGRGGLVGLIAFLILLAADLLSGVYFHDRQYYERHGWPKLLGFVVAAFIVWILGPRGLSQEERAYLTPAAVAAAKGRSFLREADSFFFVPVRYWPWILCGLGIAFFVAAEQR